MLVSFNFLFRIEKDPRRHPAPSLSTRRPRPPIPLSFFLWSSIPDDALLDLAERDRLHDPVVLAQQVSRLLRIRDRRRSWRASPASGSACGRRRRFLPDPNMFPEFDENLRRALQRETTLFVESQHPE